MNSLSELKVGKINKREVIYDTNDKIDEKVDKMLQDLSLLYDFKIINVKVKKSKSSDIKAKASIIYSYVGVIEYYEDYINNMVKQLGIPIDENTMLSVQRDPLMNKITLKEAYERFQYIPKKGDILYL